MMIMIERFDTQRDHAGQTENYNNNKKPSYTAQGQWWSVLCKLISGKDVTREIAS